MLDPQRALYGCGDPAFVITPADIRKDINGDFDFALLPHEVFLLVDGCLIIANLHLNEFFEFEGTNTRKPCTWFAAEWQSGNRPILPYSEAPDGE